MNGSSALHEQMIGKFHVVQLDKLPSNTLINSDDSTSHLMQQTPALSDDSTCASRFQMIRVDRNFGRGRWKVNDYEPPENTPISTLATSDHDSNPLGTMPSGIPVESNVTSLPSAASAPAAVFLPQQHPHHQQRLSVNNTPMVLPPGNMPSPAGLLHAYPPGALTNLATPNQSYLLANHHQFGYYPFYPPPYSPYAAQWAALAAAHPYLPPPPILPLHPSQQTGSANLNDPLRLAETDINGENPVISSNSTGDHLSNAAVATTPFLYAPHHSHSPYVPQHSVSLASPYATIPSYHPVAPLPTIIPPNQPTQSLPVNQAIPPASNDHPSNQQAPTLVSPKHDLTKNLIQHPSLIITPKTELIFNTKANNSHITDLISSSPSLTSSQQAPIVSLLSPITTTSANTDNPTATALTDIWTYTNAGSPLNLTQTAAAAIGLLNSDSNTNTAITTEILKELTTPTKQNNTADIDNKISAAMDLVKMHLLSAVREEVTDLRQRIRTLHEKINSLEHENTFLRQHVSCEIFAQYTPIIPSTHEPVISSSSSAPLTSSQPIPTTCPASLPSTLVVPPPSASTLGPLPLSSGNLPAI